MPVNTSGFNHILTPNASNLQMALDILDDHIHGSGDIPYAMAPSTDGIIIGEDQAKLDAISLVGKAVGVDSKRFRIAVFNSSGESTTAVLGGHVAVGGGAIS